MYQVAATQETTTFKMAVIFLKKIKKKCTL